jgi:hypothetical protein
MSKPTTIKRQVRPERIHKEKANKKRNKYVALAECKTVRDVIDWLKEHV